MTINDKVDNDTVDDGKRQDDIADKAFIVMMILPMIMTIMMTIMIM